MFEAVEGLVAEHAELEEQLAAGLARATEAVDSGAARAALDRWVAATR